jgi:hypothetical protein
VLIRALKARRLARVERLVLARTRALTPLESAMANAFRRAVTNVSAEARVKQIAAAIKSNSVLELEGVLNWPEFGQPIIDAVNRPALLKAMTASGAAEVRIILGRPLYALDITTPEAINWLRSAGIEALSQSEAVRLDSLRVFLEQAIQRGLSPLEAARELRDLRIVGLTARQVRSANNFARALKTSGVTGENAKRRLASFISRQLSYRAETIAMDMLTRAYAAGQRALWAQGVRDGYIDPRKAVQQWITLEDACPICVPLDRVVVPLDRPFPGGFLGPGDPHPRCRCMVIMLPFGVEHDLAA